WSSMCGRSLYSVDGKARKRTDSVTSAAVAYETGALHRGGNFGVLHEPAPHATRAQVFRAEEGDPEIDADDIRVDPPVGRMERVGETVSSIDPVAETPPHLAHRGEGQVRREHQRAGGRTGNDAPVDGFVTRRPAPRDVALA